MKKLNVKQWFSGFDSIIRTLLISSLFLFFVTYFLFEEKAKLNYSMYVPAAMMGILCLVYYIKKRVLPNFRPLICIYVFVGIAYLTSLIANPLSAIKYPTLLILAGFGTVVYLSCCIIGDTKAVLHTVLLASLVFVAAFIAVYWKSLIKLNFSVRLGDFFGNQNGIAFKLSVSGALLTSVAIYNRKYWLLVLLPFVFVCVASTGSKKGLIYLAAIAVFAICSFFRKRVWIGILISGGAVLAMILAIAFFPPLETIKDRFSAHIAYLLGQSAASASSFQRGLYRDNAFYLAFKNLFVGYGFDGFDAASGVGTYSHNNISELMCNFGLFGLLSFYGIFVYIASGFINVGRKLDATIGFYFLLGIVLLTSTAQIFYYSKMVFFLFAICIFINQKKNIEYTRLSI